MSGVKPDPHRSDDLDVYYPSFKALAMAVVSWAVAMVARSKGVQKWMKPWMLSGCSCIVTGTPAAVRAAA